MQDFSKLYEDLKQVEEQVPLVPAGRWNAVVVNVVPDQIQTQEGHLRDVLRVSLVFQNNPSVMLTDNKTPLDGQSAEYTLFLPDERDKGVPAKFGRGDMYEVSLRRLKRFFKACGVEPEQYRSFEEALQACQNAQVQVQVNHVVSEDGITYDRVVGIYG